MRVCHLLVAIFVLVELGTPHKLDKEVVCAALPGQSVFTWHEDEPRWQWASEHLPRESRPIERVNIRQEPALSTLLVQVAILLRAAAHTQEIKEEKW